MHTGKYPTVYPPPLLYMSRLIHMHKPAGAPDVYLDALLG